MRFLYSCLGIITSVYLRISLVSLEQQGVSWAVLGKLHCMVLSLVKVSVVFLVP